MMFINNIIEKIKTWYKGKYIPPSKNYPSGPLIFFDYNRYKQPLLARALKKVWQFWLKKYEWILGFIIAIVGLVVAIIALLD